jgi:hypothetical protein
MLQTQPNPQFTAPVHDPFGGSENGSGIQLKTQLEDAHGSEGGLSDLHA